MARKLYLPKTQRKRAFTLPPKIYDMKYYSEYSDDNSYFWNVDPILFSFTFDIEDRDLSPAYEYLIEIENLDTGVKKSFVQLQDAPFYRFWERQPEVYTESPLGGDEIELEKEAIVNSRVVITPVNEIGEGPQSVFFLPFKDLVWTRSKYDKGEYLTFSYLKKNWKFFSETPNIRANRPKIMYIYLDTPESDIVDDRVFLNHPQWAYDSLTNYKLINNATFRWLVPEEGQHRKLTKDGWRNSTQEEQVFITELVQTMLPHYRAHVATNDLEFRDPFVFKMAVENPTDAHDTIIIYLIKKTRWRP